MVRRLTKWLHRIAARLRFRPKPSSHVWAANGDWARSAANDRAGRELDRRSAKSEACSCVPSGTFIPGGLNALLVGNIATIKRIVGCTINTSGFRF